MLRRIFSPVSTRAFTKISKRAHTARRVCFVPAESSAVPVEVRSLIEEHTECVDLAHLFEVEDPLRVQLITPKCPLFHAHPSNSPFELDPFWAICWPGSFGLGRYIVDNPEVVSGKRVLDFAAGCGVAAILAARLGADSVCANEIDLLAIHACNMNALEHNKLQGNDAAVVDMVDNTDAGAVRASWSTCSDNLVGDVATVVEHFDVVLAGDVCYEEALAAEVSTWFRSLANEGV